MIPNGIELFQMRQRRTAAGDAYFTFRLGNAFVVMVRDKIERDLWRAVACDPDRANSRNEDVPRARAISAPDNEGWYREDSVSDDLPSDLAPIHEGEIDDGH